MGVTAGALGGLGGARAAVIIYTSGRRGVRVFLSGKKEEGCHSDQIREVWGDKCQLLSVSSDKCIGSRLPYNKSLVLNSTLLSGLVRISWGI